MDNQLPADNTFRRGDYIKCGTNIILVTGGGETSKHCAGVVIESDQSWHPVGDHSKTWHSWKFEKIAYANKLHQVEQENKELRGDIEIRNQDIAQYKKEKQAIESAFDRVSDAHSAARTLLEKVISRHLAGLLPDRLLYHEIKTFLDGK